MSILNNINQDIGQILASSRNIAIVGISNKSYRISHGIGLYLIRAGYKIFPVNPNYTTVLDLNCCSSLTEIDESIDIVNIFRRSDKVFPIVEDAIRINAKTIWMQLGVINERAAELAINAGLKVVMDHCIKIDHSIYS